MNDQKRENLLNLSLDATTAERAASSSLSTGYDFTAKTWEVIVQYQGISPFWNRRASASLICFSSTQS